MKLNYSYHFKDKRQQSFIPMNLLILGITSDKIFLTTGGFLRAGNTQRLSIGVRNERCG